MAWRVNRGEEKAESSPRGNWIVNGRKGTTDTTSRVFRFSTPSPLPAVTRERFDIRARTVRLSLAGSGLGVVLAKAVALTARGSSSQVAVQFYRGAYRS